MKFFIHTFGCRLNQAESQELEQLLVARGLELVETVGSADLVIINSCVVTIKAEKEVRQLARSIKRQNSKVKIVIAGCWVDKINQFGGLKPKGIDLLVFNQDKWVRAIEKIEKFIPKKASLAQRAIKRHRGLIRVQTGCSNFCSYCLPVLVRGKPKSVSIKTVIKKVNQAIVDDALEIVLTGQNLASYSDNNDNWLDLVEQILLKTKIKLIRFGSISPFLIEGQERSFKIAETATKRLSKMYQTIGKDRLARHLHLSLQSGSNKILKLMNRKYTAEEFLAIAGILKKNIPDLNLTTDVIVGFPGETEKDFKQTLNLVKEIGFGRIHIFRFSKRPNTLATAKAKKWGIVTESVKKQRANKLAKLEKKLRDKFCHRQTGKQLVAIIWPNGRGLTSNYINLKIKPPKIPMIVKIKLSKQAGNSMIAKMVA